MHYHSYILMVSSDGNTASELFKAQAHLYKVMFGFLTPMSIKWALDLKIPDIIHNHGKPITLQELISTLQVPQAKASCVQRFMRLLAHKGFFAIVNVIVNDDSKEGQDAYALTPTSELLVEGTDHCLSSMVRLCNDPDLLALHHQFGKWTCGEEKTIVESTLVSGDYWDFIHQNPALFKNFNEAMESDSHLVRLALKDCKSVFEGLDSLVDVGGGTGNTAKIICEALPELKYTVLDLPHVVTGLTGSKNLSFVGGDMFKSIPQADAILLKWVLHDWSDDHCIQILKNCKEAISGKNNGKVIIIDIVINENDDEHEMTETKLLLDIAMMTAHNGMERDEKDWKRLFMNAGFKNYQIFPTFGFRSLIELYP